MESVEGGDDQDSRMNTTQLPTLLSSHSNPTSSNVPLQQQQQLPHQQQQLQQLQQQPLLRGAAVSSQTHSQPPQPSPSEVPCQPLTNMTEDYANRRMSWAERRSVRMRMNEERSNSLSQLAEDFSNCDNMDQRDFQYEEFMKDSVPCPSCGGGGRIDREDESKLVALVPFDDNRLKPRRTWLYVGSAVIFSVTLALTTLFFLFPRSVKLTSERKMIFPQKVIIKADMSSPYVLLVVQNNFTIENANYLPVTLESFTMKVSAFNSGINSTTNHTQVTIPLRSNQMIYSTITLMFKNALGFIAPYCNDPRMNVHTFRSTFEVSAQASMLGHSQDMTMSVAQWVSCGNSNDTHADKVGQLVKKQQSLGDMEITLNNRVS